MRHFGLGLLAAALLLASALGLTACGGQDETHVETETTAEPAPQEDSNVDLKVRADTSGTSVEGEVRIP